VAFESPDDIGGIDPIVPAQAMSDILRQSFDVAEELKAPDHDLHTTIEDVDGTIHEFPLTALDSVESTSISGRLRLLFNTAQEDVVATGKSLLRAAKEIVQKRKNDLDG